MQETFVLFIRPLDEMWDPDLQEMKAEVVVVALLMFPRKDASPDFLVAPQQVECCAISASPLNLYRTHSAVGSAIGRPYPATSRMRAQVGVLGRLVLVRLESSTARLWFGECQMPL